MNDMITESCTDGARSKGLRSHKWRISYKTSSTMINDQPVNILHDFYIPALRLSHRYDRVAGYFRSSSLAAASLGFSAFARNDGKMRLIVGADLQLEDVEAVIKGDQQRLATELNAQLALDSSWPVGVRNGVELLAWMVTRGYLEVKVAFRVHGETGKPLDWASVEDGYVHEKWFVMQDQFGAKLYGSGTLNESKTALTINAENIDIHCDWWSETDRQRAEEAVTSFEKLWNGKVPHMPVYSLPEAVRRRLLKIAENMTRPVEVDGSSAFEPDIIEPSANELLYFALIKDAPKLPGGRFVGMYTAPVEPWPHQEIVARRLIETWPYKYLLCDEVGLGKTIEAGLAFRSLFLTGLVKRILVASPASLTEQWHRQMASKLLLPFARVLSGIKDKHGYIFPHEQEIKCNNLFEPNLIIVSTGLLTKNERLPALEEAEPFDVILLDEAHSARRKNPAKGLTGNPEFGQLYKLIRDYFTRKTKCLWLATATPMQIDPVEVCDLIALTNRVGPYQYDPTLTLAYYDLLANIMHAGSLASSDWDYLRSSTNALKATDPLLWSFIEDSVIDSRLRIATKQWLESNILNELDKNLLGRLLFCAAPLSRVMLRHSRRLLEIYRSNGQLKENLPKRNILALPRIIFNPLEKEIYDKLEVYCSGLNEQIQANNDSQARNAVGFLLSFLRLRFASSLFALQETLKRRLKKVEATLKAQLTEDDLTSGELEYSLEDLIYDEEIEDDALAVKSLLKNRTKEDLLWEINHLKDILTCLSEIDGPSTKMTELLNALDKRLIRETGRIRQTVVFTRFYDTLTDIVNRLKQAKPDVLVGTYSGQGGQYYDVEQRKFVVVHRDEVKERFLRGEIDLLVCTDAAAEGLNLQTADLLINFDLGWNPMKIEQRIGRIDRIGQEHSEVGVLNLCYLNSVEEIVYGRLLKRLAEANLIVGTQQFSLLPVTPEDFLQLAEGKMSKEVLYENAEKRMREQHQRSERMEIPPQDLYETYLRLTSSSSFIKPPVGLDDIWAVLKESIYLKKLGCKVLNLEEQKTIALNSIDEVENGQLITASRQVFEEGLPDLEHSIAFASYGEPVFEAVLNHFSNYDLPKCIRRISIQVQANNLLEVIGYAVACLAADGSRSTRLITRFNELAELELAEGEMLTDVEIKNHADELNIIARKEFGHYSAAKQIENINIKAAISHELLLGMVIYSLLKAKAKPAGSGVLFWPTLEEVNKLFNSREYFQTDIEPASHIKPFVVNLLFEVNLLAGSEQAYVKTTKMLGRSACDYAARLAESMKKRKTELTTELVLSRLRREIEAKLKKLGEL